MSKPKPIDVKTATPVRGTFTAIVVEQSGKSYVGILGVSGNHQIPMGLISPESAGVFAETLMRVAAEALRRDRPLIVDPNKLRWQDD